MKRECDKDHRMKCVGVGDSIDQEKSRIHTQKTIRNRHCEALMIKCLSRTVLYNSAKGSAVSNLNQTAGLT